MNDLMYWFPSVFQKTTMLATTTLTTWHKRLRYINFSSLKTFFRYLDIIYIDDSKDYFYDNCQRAKVTKVYNCQPQSYTQRLYQFVYRSFVRPINPVGFGKKHYFFTFKNNCTRRTKMYTGIKKINGLNAQKVTPVFAGFDPKTNTLSNTSD